MRLQIGFLIAVLLSAPLFAQANLPPGEQGARERLNNSPRHGEWSKIDAGEEGTVNSWIVFPERSGKAPVVIVVHEIYGLTDWIRSVADQLAADGFIAVAPDLLSGKGPNGGGTESVDRDGAVQLVRGLEWPAVVKRLNAVALHATGLPAAQSSLGIVGYCWGGRVAFAYAAENDKLRASVVYYGTSPEADALARIRAPILGLYGQDDARVNATIAPAEAEMKRLEKRYEYQIFDGAGHGFLRAQDGREGANLAATRVAWPRTVAFFKELLESQ